MTTVRFHAALDAIDATAWNALRPDDHPFLDHAFLAGLERHGCIRPEWGWQPHHLGLYDDGALIGAAPLYLKGNSHGEFVFDHAWAQAWERAGGRYYPKLLAAIPYTPVTGPRLLTGNGAGAAAIRTQLVAALTAETHRLGLASAHVNFVAEDECGAFDGDWLPRFDWQFHWTNRGYRDFADFLDALSHKKRKNIRAERAALQRAGLAIEWRCGASLDADEWTVVHRLYQATFAEKGNHPALSEAFFRHLGTTLGAQTWAALARRDGRIVAMALCLGSRTTLYGRYWGSEEALPGLHFELCYYQGIEHCIRAGLERFEPGAQGEHKLARGFLPTRTHSRHHLAHAGFRAAVAAALAEEAAMLDDYGRELDAHTPYAQR